MNSHAFNNIISEIAPSVYRATLSRIQNADLAQDILQQVLLLLCEKQPKFKCKAQLKVWMIRCAYKLAAGYTRRFDNSKSVPLEAAENIGTYDNIEFEFYDVLSHLPKELCDVTVLFYIEDMPQSDVAKTLGISIPAVKSRLARARALLKKIYKEEIL